MLIFTLHFMFKGMEPLSLDNPAEIEVVRRYSTNAKVFVSDPGENKIRTESALSSNSATTYIYLFIYLFIY